MTKTLANDAGLLRRIKADLPALPDLLARSSDRHGHDDPVTASRPSIFRPGRRRSSPPCEASCPSASSTPCSSRSSRAAPVKPSRSTSTPIGPATLGPFSRPTSAPGSSWLWPSALTHFPRLRPLCRADGLPCCASTASGSGVPRVYTFRVDEKALLDRINVNPAIFAGKPIIRGRRLAVEHVLGMLAAGDTPERSSKGIHGSSPRTSRPASPTLTGSSPTNGSSRWSPPTLSEAPPRRLRLGRCEESSRRLRP